jgi:hypothetical protein
MIAIDGKKVLGVENGGGKRVFLMAALDHTTVTVIGQGSIGQKTNDLPHFARLVDNISGFWSPPMTSTLGGHKPKTFTREERTKSFP